MMEYVPSEALSSTPITKESLNYIPFGGDVQREERTKSSYINP
jgi:hypothetical protein